MKEYENDKEKKTWRVKEENEEGGVGGGGARGGSDLWRQEQ